MNITVTSEAKKDASCQASVTIAASDVNTAVKKAYKDIAQKYRFQGFRKGRAPRPVIDSIVGKEAVLADATNALVNAAEPLVIEKLDIVPVGEPRYNDGKDPELAKEGSDFNYQVEFGLRPSCELKSYDAPSIEMPPSEVTETEVEAQVKRLLSYHTSYEDIEESREVRAGDIVQLDIENIENGEPFVGKNRMLSLNGEGLPSGFEEGLYGMKAQETKEISFETPFVDNSKDEVSSDKDTEDKDGEKKEQVRTARLKVTIQKIKKKVTPELTDDFVKKSFGFDSVDALKDAIHSEIETEKKNKLPSLKEDRLVEALSHELILDKVPEDYEQQVFNELAQTFLKQLQAQGTTLDAFLSARGIEVSTFIADLHNQAEERARQSLALDALAAKLELSASDEELKKEFVDIDAKNADATYQKFLKEGRLPAVRESIRRSKALQWMVEHAVVTEVDETAETKDAQKPAKAKASATKKKTSAASSKKKSSASSEKSAGSQKKTSSKKAESSAADAPSKASAAKKSEKAEKSAQAKKSSKKDSAASAKDEDK